MSRSHPQHVQKFVFDVLIKKNNLIGTAVEGLTQVYLTLKLLSVTKVVFLVNKSTDIQNEIGHKEPRFPYLSPQIKQI